MDNIPAREKWSSQLAFIWVASGAAIGLGNVWKFPYMAGSNGGSAFVVLYLACVLLVAIPVLAAEILLGKISQRNAVDGFIFLAARQGLSYSWRWVGYLGLLTLQLIFCFYSVIAGFSIAYFYFAITNSFAGKSPMQIQVMWQEFLSDPSILLFCSFLFIFFTMAIVHGGIKKGLEKACNLMMPALLIVLAILVGYASFSGGFLQAIDFLFSFKVENINPSVVIASLGHALFTLAVGACAMMVYGSHLSKRISVIKSVFMVALLDVVVALLAGLAIFPLTFEHGIEPGQGPGLMFVSLPIIFAGIPYGWLFGSLFFILLFFAALSSSLSFAEPLVDVLVDKFRIVRHQASIVIALSTFLGSFFCALSFNVFSHILIFSRLSIFDAVADFCTNILLPVGAILIAIFAGLVIKKTEIFSPGIKYGDFLYRCWKITILLVAPLAVIIVMINAFV
jgi:NSS family neurotransmitter:Na+ symporter